jgi:hypothetical protein
MINTTSINVVINKKTYEDLSEIVRINMKDDDDMLFFKSRDNIINELIVKFIQEHTFKYRSLI